MADITDIEIPPSRTHDVVDLSVSSDSDSERSSLMRRGQRHLSTFSAYSRFSVQLSLSLTIVIFSLCNIWRKPGQDNSVSYSMVSSIVGYWLPAPSRPIS